MEKTLSVPCRVCKQKGGVKRLGEYGKEKIPGLLCIKCSTFVPDMISVEDKVECIDCKKKMGIVARHVAVLLDGVVVHRAEPKKTFRCRDCSEKATKTGEPNPDIHVRYEVLCCGGCGNLQAWEDCPEGVAPQNANFGSCMKCEPRLADIARNQRSLDNAVKSNVSDRG